MHNRKGLSTVEGYGNHCIPSTVIKRLENEIRGMDFGGVSLIIAIRDSHPTYRIEKTISVLAGDNDAK
jgi:hypothetical protein